MSAPSTSSCLREIFSVSRTTSQRNLFLPLFLVPSARHCSGRRNFTMTRPRASKLARTPISLPPDVSLTLSYPKPSANTNPLAGHMDLSPTLKFQGPLGELSLQIPEYMSIQRVRPGGPITLNVKDSKIRQQREMWGTTRAYINNNMIGVSEGHTAILKLVGVGYRASIETTATTVGPEYEGQKYVNLKVGYSHPIELGVPKGVTASCPQPTRILLEGMDKQVLKQFAAHIRQWRVPEPYKGKGIFVNDETIQLKAKKIK